MNSVNFSNTSISAFSICAKLTYRKRLSRLGLRSVVGVPRDDGGGDGDDDDDDDDGDGDGGSGGGGGGIVEGGSGGIVAPANVTALR